MLRKISLFITKPGSTNQIELIKFLACDSEFNPSATLASAASHQMAKIKLGPMRMMTPTSTVPMKKSFPVFEYAGMLVVNTETFPYKRSQV